MITLADILEFWHLIECCSLVLVGNLILILIINVIFETALLRNTIKEGNKV